MSLLKRKQRFQVFKFLALLSVVRWYNILAILVAQYLCAFYVFDAHEPWLKVIANPYLHLTLFSLGLITAGGFVINSFYDAEKDWVNRPNQTLFERLLSKNFILNAYLIFNLVGIIIAYFISKQIFAFALTLAFLLWFYSHKLKKKVLIGSISAAFLSVFPLLAMPILYRDYEFVFYVYAGFFFMFNLIRQVVKNMLEMKGDAIFGYNTLPIIWGVGRTQRLLALLMASASVPLFSIVAIKGISALSVYFFVAGLLMVYSAIRIKWGKMPAVLNEVNTLYKVLLLTTIISIALLRL